MRHRLDLQLTRVPDSEPDEEFLPLPRSSLGIGFPIAAFASLCGCPSWRVRSPHASGFAALTHHSRPVVPPHSDAEVVGVLRSLRQRQVLTNEQAERAVDQHFRTPFTIECESDGVRQACRRRAHDRSSRSDGWASAPGCRHLFRFARPLSLVYVRLIDHDLRPSVGEVVTAP